MKKVLLTLFIYVGGIIIVSATEHHLFVKLLEETRVPLYDSTCQFVVDTLHHDIINENYVLLRVESCVGEMIFVQPYWSLSGDTCTPKGWVYLSEDITIYPHDDVFPLYIKPSYVSDSVMVRYEGDELPVLKYSNGWVYTQIFDITGRKSEGWLSPRNQCDNPYTTCN